MDTLFIGTIIDGNYLDLGTIEKSDTTNQATNLTGSEGEESGEEYCSPSGGDWVGGE